MHVCSTDCAICLERNLGDKNYHGEPANRSNQLNYLHNQIQIALQVHFFQPFSINLVIYYLTCAIQTFSHTFYWCTYDEYNEYFL